MKVMIRRSPETGLSIYVPKKDLEEPIVESEHESLWGGWIRIANGWVLDLPEMAVGTSLPITVNARKRGQEEFRFHQISRLSPARGGECRERDELDPQAINRGHDLGIDQRFEFFDAAVIRPDRKGGVPPAGGGMAIELGDAARQMLEKFENGRASHGSAVVQSEYPVVGGDAGGFHPAFQRPTLGQVEKPGRETPLQATAHRAPGT